jgi:hypothetical protein
MRKSTFVPAFSAAPHQKYQHPEKNKRLLNLKDRCLHLAPVRCISTFSFNPMEHKDLLISIEEKIVRLGESRRELQQQLARLKDENDSLYRINKELLSQVNELTEKNRELENTRSLHVAPQEEFRVATKQRINDLVKEIDECIALLNK